MEAIGGLEGKTGVKRPAEAQTLCPSRGEGRDPRLALGDGKEADFYWLGV